MLQLSSSDRQIGHPATTDSKTHAQLGKTLEHPVNYHAVSCCICATDLREKRRRKTERGPVPTPPRSAVPASGTSSARPFGKSESNSCSPRPAHRLITRQHSGDYAKSRTPVLFLGRLHWLLRREQRDTLKRGSHSRNHDGPVVIRPAKDAQSDRAARQYSNPRSIKHRQRSPSHRERQPKLTLDFSLVRRERPRPSHPKKKADIPFSRTAQTPRRNSLSSRSLRAVAVGVNDGKRSFYICPFDMILAEKYKLASTVFYYRAITSVNIARERDGEC